MVISTGLVARRCGTCAGRWPRRCAEVPAGTACVRAVDDEGQLARGDMEQLDGAGAGADPRRCSSPGISRQSHISSGPRRLGADEQRGVAARLGGPHAGRPARRDDADLGALLVVEQGGDADAEGVGDLDDGAEAGVGTGLLDLDDHAAADPGAGGEGVQGEAALGAPALEVAGQRLGEQVEVRHSSVQYLE